MNVCFGEGWDERVLEHMPGFSYEAGLVEEFCRDSGKAGEGRGPRHRHDVRAIASILATAIARLRGRAEIPSRRCSRLMAPAFTLLELQRAVEIWPGFACTSRIFAAWWLNRG